MTCVLLIVIAEFLLCILDLHSLVRGCPTIFFPLSGRTGKGNALTLGMEGLSAPKGSMLVLSAKMFEDAAIGWNYNHE